MKYLVILFTLYSAMLAPHGVCASEITELKITGTIRPGACLAIFPPGSIIDFGTIKADMHLQGDYKAMPVQHVALQIACDGPTKIAVSASDNRRDSHDANIKDMDPRSNFGLGKYRGRNIGGYWVKVVSAIADGKNTDILVHTGPQGNRHWTAEPLRHFRHDDGQFSFGNGSGPIAFNKLTANLDVSARLSKRAYLEMADDIQLDGSLSLEIIYL